MGDFDNGPDVAVICCLPLPIRSDGSKRLGHPYVIASSLAIIR